MGAPFMVDGTDAQIVSIPFTDFSYDWSAYTGACDTLDPTGQQHVCCTDETPDVCPTADFLAKITDVEVWAEGTEGDFHLEVFCSVRAMRESFVLVSRGEWTSQLKSSIA